MKGIFFALVACFCLCFSFVGCTDDGASVLDAQVEAGSSEDASGDVAVGGEMGVEAGSNDILLPMDAGVGDVSSASDVASD